MCYFIRDFRPEVRSCISVSSLFCFKVSGHKRSSTTECHRGTATAKDHHAMRSSVKKN